MCCPPFGFKCGYGACIDEKLKCNGISDCLDESDENDLLCGYRKNLKFPITPPKKQAETRVLGSFGNNVTNRLSGELPNGV